MATVTRERFAGPGADLPNGARKGNIFFASPRTV
jgi:hypothetical protein